MITIIDYGMGNLGSVQNMFRYLGVASTISADPEVISKAEKLLLPGVGAFDNAMLRLNQHGFREILNQKAQTEKVPVLGICLGMQLLTRGSEEGDLPGLNFIPADTVRFPDSQGLKVPHMGWNLVLPSTESVLTRDLPEESRFYFVHSYCVHTDDPAHSVLKADYGVRFDAAIQKDNIFGAQFHPEKSHKFGMQLFKNFASL